MRLVRRQRCRAAARPFGGMALLLAVLSLSACASDPGSVVYPPPGAAHRVGSPGLELFWRCGWPKPQVLRVEGWAINRGFVGEVRNLRFELVGVDMRGGTVSATKSPTVDRLGLMRSEPFVLDVRTHGTEARFDLYYEYIFHEPGDDTFDSGDARQHIGPGVQVASSHSIMLAQVPSRFLVWNVCDEALHRVK